MSNSNLIIENYKIDIPSQKITDLDINLDIDYDNLKVNGKKTGGESSKKLYTNLLNNNKTQQTPPYTGPILIYDGTDLYSYVGTPDN